MCGITEWHRIEKCENTDEIQARRLKRIKSDLFSKCQYEIPSPQNQSMIRNSHLPFLRLPPEIRRRIYRLILGDHDIWIGHWPEEIRSEWADWADKLTGKLPKRATIEAHTATKKRFHRGGQFYYIKSGGEYPNSTLDFRLLRTCRQIYMETALLPYWLNNFFFQDDAVRKRFEKSPRVGKKRAQKQAVGKYEIMSEAEFKAQKVQEQYTGF